MLSQHLTFIATKAMSCCQSEAALIAGLLFPKLVTDKKNSLKNVSFWTRLRGSLSGSETACKQTWKLSLSHPHPSYSIIFSALGKVCEWAVALSSSSVCSGVSRRHEVIEFPLLKISISTAAGNLPGMKWMYVM